MVIVAPLDKVNTKSLPVTALLSVAPIVAVPLPSLTVTSANVTVVGTTADTTAANPTKLGLISSAFNAPLAIESIAAVLSTPLLSISLTSMFMATSISPLF